MKFNKGKKLVTIQSIKQTTAAVGEQAQVLNNLRDGLKKSFRKILQTIIKKIQERGSLQYNLVRNAACLNPINLVTVDPETLQKIFDRVVLIMFKNK